MLRLRVARVEEGGEAERFERLEVPALARDGRVVKLEVERARGVEVEVEDLGQDGVLGRIRRVARSVRVVAREARLDGRVPVERQLPASRRICWHGDVRAVTS